MSCTGNAIHYAAKACDSLMYRPGGPDCTAFASCRPFTAESALETTSDCSDDSTDDEPPVGSAPPVEARPPAQLPPPLYEYRSGSGPSRDGALRLTSAPRRLLVLGIGEGGKRLSSSRVPWSPAPPLEPTLLPASSTGGSSASTCEWRSPCKNRQPVCTADATGGLRLAVYQQRVGEALLPEKQGAVHACARLLH